ncbi:protein RKD5 [Telopea speciosissima]|uniref:protein RKD5 n=1 Tax=Telopea speciosissima TaxID=54955 RepID=UPI001CC4AC61|nr:protein RKD5 [Telopea speciosissima]
MLDLDLNCPPPIEKEELLESQQSDEAVPEASVKEKKKRAATEDIARISLSDLVKNFGRPIAEASRNLNVGLTVLKRKCRELGIPRWPHRKIKSLDSLIHDLQDIQEDTELQESEDKATAIQLAKRQRMLESEKEGIERTPSMEIQSEIKKFRQGVFKSRHRARTSAKAKKCSSISPNSKHH